jgi:hypothetical protein
MSFASRSPECAHHGLECARTPVPDRGRHLFQSIRARTASAAGRVSRPTLLQLAGAEFVGWAGASPLSARRAAGRGKAWRLAGHVEPTSLPTPGAKSAATSIVIREGRRFHSLWWTPLGQDRCHDAASIGCGVPRRGFAGARSCRPQPRQSPRPPAGAGAGRGSRWSSLPPATPWPKAAAETFGSCSRFGWLHRL